MWRKTLNWWPTVAEDLAQKTTRQKSSRSPSLSFFGFTIHYPMVMPRSENKVTAGRCRECSTMGDQKIETNPYPSGVGSGAQG
jgi:hypothetical protein